MNETATEKKETKPASAKRWNTNEVKMQGRLSKDPEIHEFEGGKRVLNLTVALNRNYQDKNGEWKQKVAFVDVSLYGASIEEARTKLKKGQEVYVEGRLRQDIWLDKEQKTQSKLRVDAFKLEPVVREKSKSAEAEIER